MLQSQTLKGLAKNLLKRGLADLLTDDERNEALWFQTGTPERDPKNGVTLDISRQVIDSPALAALLAEAEASGLSEKIAALFAGEAINRSEERPVLHTRVRDPKGPFTNQINQMIRLAEHLRADPSLDDIVHIGIGGSDLGPKLVYCALQTVCDGPRVHFVGNVHAADLADALSNCDPDRTLIIITSKTFTTVETLQNAETARAFLSRGPGATGLDASKAAAWVADRIVGVTAHAARAVAWGCGRTLEFDEGIGGRFSVWSSVGLPVAIGVGGEAFRGFLMGAHTMDCHFRDAPLASNLPVLMGCLRIWNRNFLGLGSQAIVPYDQRLGLLSAWMQQLEMESNGKSVHIDGKAVTHKTAPVIWGEVGTNAQHSFFQFLHQGSDIVPLDLLIPREFARLDGPNKQGMGQLDWTGHLRQVHANALAQAEALALGDPQPNDPQRSFSGGRPVSVLVWQVTDANRLGKLMALYEHVTVVAGFLWGINSFDQWGIELGKHLAKGYVTGGEAGGLRRGAARLWRDLRGEQGL